MANGELAVNFAGGAASDTRPALYVGDGTNVIKLLDQSDFATNIAIKSVSIPIATPGAPNLVTDANAANAWTVVPGELAIISHDGSAYVFSGGPGTYGSGGTPTTAGMFTGLGSATAFATAAQILAGAPAGLAVSNDELVKIISPAILTAGVTAAQPNHPTVANRAAATGIAADEGRIVVLDNTGKVPAALLSVTGLTFAAEDATAGATTTNANGTVVTNTGSGALAAGWGITGNPTVQPGDMLLGDGTTWHLIESVVDMSAYLPLSGGTLATATGAAAGTATVAFDLTNAVADATSGNKVALDAGGGAVENAVIDGGQFP